MTIQPTRTPVEIRQRFDTTLSAVQEAASHLTPEDIVSHGEFLGAGLQGGSYEVHVDGQTLVAKQFGHPEAQLSQLMGPSGVQRPDIQAAKQVVAQNALVLAGVPAPVSVLLAPGSSWVVMQKMDGLGLKTLAPEERGTARDLGKQVEREVEPVVAQALETLKPQYPDNPELLECNVDLSENLVFKRTPDGLRVAGVFDPLI